MDQEVRQPQGKTNNLEVETGRLYRSDFRQRAAVSSVSGFCCLNFKSS